MIRELLREEEVALNEFTALMKDSSIKIKDCEEAINIDPSNAKEVLEKLVIKLELALKECHAIESLDKQLKLIAETQDALKDLKKRNELSHLILNSMELSKIVPLALEWKNCKGEGEDENENENVKRFINEKLPNMVNEEIEKVLLSWTDDVERRDQESIKILQRLDSNNPLHCLFASYPLSKLRTLLEYHRLLGNNQDIGQYPDRVLNRFYDILQSESAETKTAPFSVGQIEVLISEKMKFASRISCILEATFSFIKLHPEMRETFVWKCWQICKQIRKCAEDERDYDKDSNAAVLDSKLNEISLIISSLSSASSLSGECGSGESQSETSGHSHSQTSYQTSSQISSHSQTSETLRDNTYSHEYDKWMEIYLRLEEIYLAKGIQQAIEIDQIITTSEDFPVSSCVDDIFYVLKAAKGRIEKLQPNSNLIQNSLRDFFLNVLKKYLETSIQNLKPIEVKSLQSSSPFRPSRELITSLVLINNLIATKTNWRRVNPNGYNNDIVEKDIQNILEYALNDGIYSKLLKKEKDYLSNNDLEELFIKIHSLLTMMNNLFKTTMAKEALDHLFGLSIADFSQIFCKKLYDHNLSTSFILKYDRLLHELTNHLEDTLKYDHSANDPSLRRLKQSISLLLAESRSEARELVTEWKNENNCQLRAGEILLIMNKLK